MGKDSKERVQSQSVSRQGGDGKTISKYRKDQTIFAQGDIADTIYLHSKRQGQNRRRIRSGQGSGRRNYGSRCFFGEGCLNGQSLRIATATAMEECLITSITKTAMMDGPSE